MSELRSYNAEYYDAFLGKNPEDVVFYRQFLGRDASILELGCGTGRVTFPLAQTAREVVGVDISEEMILRAKEKSDEENVSFVIGDITNIELNKKFDLIIAPFRVLQAMETDEMVFNFFATIKRHLAPGGLSILNVFNPFLNREEMGTKWMQEGEIACEEIRLKNGDIIKHSEKRKSIDTVNQVLYVDLIYRRYRDKKLVDTHINFICMKYYYPEEFKDLILSNGFVIKDSWGGYRPRRVRRGGRSSSFSFQLKA